MRRAAGSRPPLPVSFARGALFECDSAILACPGCRGALVFAGRASAGRLQGGRLECAGCAAGWPIDRGLPRLVRESEVRGTDRLLRAIYDGLPSLHDPATALLTPLLQGTSEREGRRRYLGRLALDELRGLGRPPRVLEIGIGAGANLDLLLDGGSLPPGSEYFGLDLSAGMLAQAERRLARSGLRGVRLLLGDAHALPFVDGSFDRVFEVGGINGYRDRRRALAEMARVARPGTPIVVVDEQLAETHRRSLLHRAAFRALTFYTDRAEPPLAELPPGATDVAVDQITPYYFALRFRVR